MPSDFNSENKEEKLEDKGIVKSHIVSNNEFYFIADDYFDKNSFNKKLEEKQKNNISVEDKEGDFEEITKNFDWNSFKESDTLFISAQDHVNFKIYPKTNLEVAHNFMVCLSLLPYFKDDENQTIQKIIKLFDFEDIHDLIENIRNYNLFNDKFYEYNISKIVKKHNNLFFKLIGLFEDKLVKNETNYK